MNERLARLTREDLSEKQAAVYDAIAGGPRAQGLQLFALKDSEGALNGPFGIMLHVPDLGLPLQDLGASIRYRTGLTDRCREIAILTVAACVDSAFEWYAHERVGRAAGLTEAELQALRNGTFNASDPVEDAVALLARTVLGGAPLADEYFARSREVLGETTLLEVTVLVGYYRTLADLMRVCAVGAPPETA